MDKVKKKVDYDSELQSSVLLKMDPVSQQWRRSHSYGNAVILSWKTNRTEAAATAFVTPDTL